MAFAPAFFGYNFVFWLTASILRYITEITPRFLRRLQGLPAATIPTSQLSVSDVAVIIAAHNEELALPETIIALTKNVSASQIYIGSDASTDATVAIARAHGCNVVDLTPNRGKSKVLAHLLKHFDILARYKAVLIMDAEIIISHDYLATILPYFDDPTVAAFVSHSHARWHRHTWPKWSMFFTAYRLRLWLVLYYAVRYGQTWRYTCATPIIPGGSSVYRSSVLSQIEIDTPGLIIEDFHMTFQVYHKKLGRIASHPSAYIIDQEPYNLHDYFRQVYRWFLGFWQTFFYHGFWPSFFWFATALFTIEMCASSLIVITLPFMVLAMLFFPSSSHAIFHVNITSLSIDWVPITWMGIFIGFFAIDYLLTILASAIERKPLMLVYGLGFFFLRYIDTFVFLWTLPIALLARTNSGIWKSPERKLAV